MDKEQLLSDMEKDGKCMCAENVIHELVSEWIEDEEDMRENVLQGLIVLMEAVMTFSPCHHDAIRVIAEAMRMAANRSEELGAIFSECEDDNG